MKKRPTIPERIAEARELAIQDAAAVVLRKAIACHTSRQGYLYADAPRYARLVAQEEALRQVRCEILDLLPKPEPSGTTSTGDEA